MRYARIYSTSYLLWNILRLAHWWLDHPFDESQGLDPISRAVGYALIDGHEELYDRGIEHEDKAGALRPGRAPKANIYRWQQIVMMGRRFVGEECWPTEICYDRSPEKAEDRPFNLN